MKQQKKPVNYVDNKKFYQAIVDYRKSVKEHKEKGLNTEVPRIPDYIGECIYKIAHHLSTKPCFMSYSFRDEMIEDGIENSFLYFHNYDPDYVSENSVGPNPFAYFSQIIYFAFLRRIGEEERKRYLLYKNFFNVIGPNHDSLAVIVDGDNNPLLTKQMYDNIAVFMEKFEKKEQEKKNKRKQVKVGLDKFL